MQRRPWLIALLAAALATALVAVGWFDYLSARREFDLLVRAHAASVRDTIAAAARSNHTAAEQAQAELVERLLDNARLLAEMDRRGGLSPTLLDAVVKRNHLFRLTMLDARGERALYGGAVGAGPGRGQGGPGWGAGAGIGGGPGAGLLIDRLITGKEPEAVTDLHAGRRTGAARLAAGVRRHDGGAIIISVDASDVLNLQQQSSLSTLLDDIVAHAEDVAYLVYEQGDVRRTSGQLPGDLGQAAPAHLPGAPASEREVEIAGQPVLELTGPVDLGTGTSAHVHLGMRLDGVRRAERRTLVRLLTSLGAATLIGVLAFGLVWLYQRYGTLSLEHQRAQEALRRRDRLAAMGELASTVAHEIRNPLNAIAMSAQRLRREFFDRPEAWTAADREDAGALVGVVQGEAQRINGKVQQFLEFARPPALAPRPTPLEPWLRPVAESIAPLAASRQVTFHYAAPGNPDVLIDPEQLRQAVDNLLRNAVEATPAGGTVSLSARTTAQELLIEVHDTGPGIAPEHLPKIFDLYFTTKPDGTGVGLAVTQQIVVGHSGRLDVDSVPGAGTTMRIVLPRSSTHV